MNTPTAALLCLLALCASAGVRADDLMENDDLAPTSIDLGELPPPVGQQALIEQIGQANVALLSQNG